MQEPAVLLWLLCLDLMRYCCSYVKTISEPAWGLTSVLRMAEQKDGKELVLVTTELSNSGARQPPDFLFWDLSQWFVLCSKTHLDTCVDTHSKFKSKEGYISYIGLQLFSFTISWLLFNHFFLVRPLGCSVCYYKNSPEIIFYMFCMLYRINF